MALAPGTGLGPCEVTVLIGSGGIGAVYQPRDRKLGTEATHKSRETTRQ